MELGLSGAVAGEEFRGLLSGFSPDGSRRLVHNAGSELRRSGWDLTWSVPKSVSVLWSQASPELREGIELEVRASVQRAVRFLETVGVVSRRGTDGVVHEPAKLVFAAFEHSTSRALDPQLHVHTILINLGIRPDGTTGTLEPRELYRHQLAAGALFRAELASRLEQRLGFRARRAERCFEVIGVPAALIDEFSKRRAQIEARLAELGLNTAAAAEMAALDTRPDKEALPRDELFPRWRNVGQQHHWGLQEIDWIRNHPHPARNLEIERAMAGPVALHAVTINESHFASRHLIQALAEEGQGRGLNADAVLEMHAALLNSPNVVLLRDVAGEPQWTTPEMLAIETHALQLANAMHARERQLLEALPTEPRADGLSAEQQAALRHVTSAIGGIRIISGMAGTGKSTVFRTAREVWASQGLTVYGACLAGKAALGLTRATEIPAQTLQRMLLDLDRGWLTLTRRHVVLVDEAGMVGTRQMDAMLGHCLRAGATLILCGDARQLQAIEAGGIFPELARRFGAADLVEIRRQQEDWMRHAVAAFADGRAGEALDLYDAHGWVTMDEDPVRAMAGLCSEQASQAPTAEPTLVVANRVADAQFINRRIQHARRSAGELSKAHLVVAANLFHVGDRIVFTRNSMSLGVWNGQLAEIIGLCDGKITARLDDKTVVAFDPERYPHFQLGYALTTHKAQGLTVKRACIYADVAAENREAAYVQASRAKLETRIFGVAEDREQLVSALIRSRPKVMATMLLRAEQEPPTLSLRMEL